MDMRVEPSLKRALEQLAQKESRKHGIPLTLTDIATQILQQALDARYEATADQLLGLRLQNTIAEYMTFGINRLARMLVSAMVESNATRRAVLTEMQNRRGLEYAQSLAEATYVDSVRELGPRMKEAAKWLEELEAYDPDRGEG